MSYYDEDCCQECGCENGDHLEDCAYLAERETEIKQMTMSEAIAYSRFSGNCYCLTSLREIDIIDLDDRVKTTPMKSPAKTVKLLTDRERVAKVQKDRAHIYRRPSKD